MGGPDPSPPRVFRVRFWSLYLFACAAALIAVPAILLATRYGMDRFFTVAGGSCVLLAPLSLLMVAMLEVRVDGEALRGHDPFGVAMRVPWASIAEVTLFPVPGLPFYRVSVTGKKRELWLPGFLRDEAGFARAVREAAGSGNPLSGFLEGRRRVLTGASSMLEDQDEVGGA